jgi:hyperosmotically inducible periplasmic protein
VTGATRIVLLAATVAAGMSGPARADQDADVAANVQRALIAAHIPNAANIGVHEFNGEVELSGVVYSERNKARAASVAGSVPGVTALNNRLEVQPHSSDEDEAITARVQAALVAAQIPGAGPIEVSTFNGEVDLSGTVYSQEAGSRVMNVAGSTPGVTSLSSEIEIRDR